MRLSALAHILGVPLAGADADVTGIAVDSREARAGDLFVALHGARVDGRAFAADAVARGAVAVCAPEAVPGTPSLVVADTRGALAHLAAALYGYPARALRLIGVTGTLGKTSTALLVQSALETPARSVGVIGSLGVRVRGAVVDTGMTTPEAPALHRALRAMADAGVGTVVLEVTSHGIAMERVAGLPLALGVFTNLVPDEHLEFHGTAHDYLRTKARFFDMLADGAPLVLNHDDALVGSQARAAVARRAREVVEVSAAGDADAAVAVEGLRVDGAGAVFALRVRRALPTLDGGVVEPGVIPLVLPVLGVQQVANAALAAAAALVAGATPGAVTEAVAEVIAPRRRMQLVRAAAPAVLDDTVGNPRSLRAVFESIRALPHARLRIAFGIRGMRGPVINERLATTLGELVRAHGARRPAHLVITASEDTAGPRDRVQPEERDTVLAALRDAAVPFHFEPELGAAIARVLDGWEADDLVLLLGAQGMDRAAELVQEALAR